MSVTLRRPGPITLALATLTAGALLAGASWLQAHDFWLAPGAFPFAAGADVGVLGQTSTRFPTSQSAVAPERVARAVLVGPAGPTPVTDLSVRATSLLLRARPSQAGEYIVAVDLQARSVRQAPAGAASSWETHWATFVFRAGGDARTDETRRLGRLRRGA